MTNYIYTIKTKKHNYKLGTTKIRAWVYKIKKNKPIFIESAERKEGMTKGGDAEVLAKLVEIGELPKKELIRSEEPGRGPGYYVFDNGKYTITAI